MIFLVVRTNRRLRSITVYDERKPAERARLALELLGEGDPTYEVNTLEAPSLAHLLKTHGAYLEVGG